MSRKRVGTGGHDHPAWIHHEGALGGPGFTQKPARTRHMLLNRSIARDGVRVTAARLQVLLRNRHISPVVRATLLADLDWLHRTYS